MDRRAEVAAARHTAVCFSFLDGASHPWELAKRAADLEMPALALTDSGGVYGAVRFVQSCQAFGVRPILGTALEVDGEEIVLLAKSLRGWSNLCRLYSLAHRDQPQGEARTTLATAARHRGDLIYLTATRDDSKLRTLQENSGWMPSSSSCATTSGPRMSGWSRCRRS